MLKPTEDRFGYGENLRPRAGYTCEFAVGTTYSLDLEALLGIPLKLLLSEEMDGTLLENPVHLLEGLRQSADKFALFYDVGQIKSPGKINPVFSLLEHSINEVALKDFKSFHPKVWIIKYTGSGKTLYRVIVMSRSLTFDRSWDIAVVLEGSRTGQKTGKNQPLAGFPRLPATACVKPENPETTRPHKGRSFIYSFFDRVQRLHRPRFFTDRYDEHDSCSL